MSNSLKEEEAKRLIGKIFFNKYKLRRIIAKGSFSYVFEGVHLKTKDKVAVKVEVRSVINVINNLKDECGILLSCQGSGIPKILSFGIWGKYYVLILEMLGKSLLNILLDKKIIINLKDVCMIAIQMIERLKFIHSKFIIHCDLKFENILFGLKDPSILYLIDFGFAKKYRSSRTKNHIKLYNTNRVFGSIYFLSINANKGMSRSRRDDLESLGYILIFILKRFLPWNKVREETVENVIKVYKMKKEATPEKICEGLPSEFAEYITYCRNLKFEEKPNYRYLQNLFISVMEKNNYDIDYNFSWIKTNMKIKKPLIEIKKNVFSADKVNLFPLKSDEKKNRKMSYIEELKILFQKVK